MNRDVQYDVHTGGLTIRLNNRYDEPRNDSSGSELSSLGGLEHTFSELITLTGAKLSWQDAYSQELVTSVLSVPNNLIGCIIGVGGTKIRNISRISGAKISISKEGPTYRGDRSIRILGNQKAVAIAEYTIKKSMKLKLESFVEGQKPFYQRSRNFSLGNSDSTAGALIPTLFSLRETAGFQYGQNNVPNNNFRSKRGKLQLKSFLEGQQPFHQRSRNFPHNNSDSTAGTLVPTLFSLRETGGWPCGQNRYRPY